MFEFATAARVVFGEGAIERLAETALEFGRRVLVVVGSNPDRVDEHLAAMSRAGCVVDVLSVLREPNAEDLAVGVERLRAHRADVVVAIGGGSVMDTAKAVAAVSGNDGELEDYLEVIGRGLPLARAGIPCIAVPTTSGTGAEVTRNAVVDVPAHRVKVSLRSQHLLPKVALLDPMLTLSVPPEVTAATGFDALAQVIEPYVSNRANDMTDALAVSAIRLAAKALRRAYFDGSDLEARRDMALVSLWGGMCLANARLGAVHGLAGPIGGLCHAPHGALCAALLAPVMRANISALRRDPSGARTLARYTEVARLVTGGADARAEEGAEFIAGLARDLGVRRLGALGVKPDDFAEIVPRAMRASSMQGNPVQLQSEEVNGILIDAS